MEKEAIDLRTCKFGDKLISTHGAELMYVRPTNEREYLDHVVEYKNPKLGKGTRTHDGFVFAKNRKAADHNIVKIIRL